MKLTNVKALVAKSLTVGLLAGAFVLAVPAKADAQQFAVGVQFGSPSYGYDNPRDYYARQRYEELCRQRASKYNRRMRGSRRGLNMRPSSVTRPLNGRSASTASMATTTAVGGTLTTTVIGTGAAGSRLT